MISHIFWGYGRRSCHWTGRLQGCFVISELAYALEGSLTLTLTLSRLGSQSTLCHWQWSVGSLFSWNSREHSHLPSLSSIIPKVLPSPAAAASRPLYGSIWRPNLQECSSHWSRYRFTCSWLSVGNTTSILCRLSKSFFSILKGSLTLLVLFASTSTLAWSLNLICSSCLSSNFVL